MPGRQYTRAPNVSISRKKNARRQNKKKDRSINALAIAEKQVPDDVKIRKSRLGEVDDDDAFPRRKRRAEDYDDHEGSEEGEEDEDDSRRRRKKARRDDDPDVEEGSDSEGNEWMLGGVDDDDDESLDSDEAFGEGDEEAFEGFTFRGSSKRKKNKGAEEESEKEDDGESLGSDAVDLVEMFDQGEVSDEEDHRQTKAAKSDLQVESDEDEEEDSEEDNEEDDWELSASEDEDEIDDVKLAALQDLVTSLQPTTNNGDNKKRPEFDAHEAETPSTFGITPSQKLTITDLLPTVNDTLLKRSLKLLATDEEPGRSSKKNGIPGKLDVPLAKRQQDLLDREAAYKKSKETLARWLDTVKHNRRAEHLSFPLPDESKMNAEGTKRLTSTAFSQPMTELESAIQNILQESGLADTKAEEKLQAFEELKTNKLPLEEVQRRRAELRKARDLLFREEIRAKRIKKIKSKAYRRVHRKEREKQEEAEREALRAAGVDLSEEEREQNDRKRAEERMGAKHRESKWARGVKQTGRAAWDEDARAGVVDMARRAEELKTRIQGRTVRNDEDGDDFSDTESESNDNDSTIDDAEAQRQKYKSQLDKLSDESAIHNGLWSRLSSLKFMKRANEAQKAQNDEVVEQLQRELDEGQSGSDLESKDDEDEEELVLSGRRKFGVPEEQTIKPKVQKDLNEFEEAPASEDEEDQRPASDDEEVEIVTESKSVARKRSAHPLTRVMPNKKPGRYEEPNVEMDDNPWTSAATNAKNRKSKKNTGPEVLITQTNGSDPETQKHRNASSTLQRKPASVSAKSDGDQDGGQSEDEENAPVMLRNEALVREAFAGDEVVAAFEKEKKKVIKEEDDKVIDNTLPGWGNWVGEGVSKKQRKRNQGRFLTKVEGVKPNKRKDAKLQKVIINEKKIKKNSKYLAATLPHPFENKAQYERSLRLPVGPEWTTKKTFQDATKPRVMIKQGIIKAMEKPLL